MSDPFVRVALVNYSPKMVTLEVETEDAFEYRQLRTDTPKDRPDGKSKDIGRGKHRVEVPAGAICGFASRAMVKITNATAENVSVISANGKDPWPQPPPPAPSAELNANGDYVERFNNFLLTEGLNKGVRQPMVMIIEPAGAG